MRDYVNSETLMRVDLRQMRCALNSPYESPVFSENVTVSLIENVLIEHGFRDSDEILGKKAKDVFTAIRGAAQGEDIADLAFAVYKPHLYLTNKASHIMPPAWFLIVWALGLWCTGTCMVCALHLWAGRRFRERQRAMLQQWRSECERP